MRTIIIIGQDISKKYPKAKPWSKGASSSRLMSWFDFDSYSELSNAAHLTNVSEFDSVPEVIEYIMRKKASHVFLVGKIAQRIFPYESHNMTSRTIEKKLFHFLPHPSGSNVSCNHLDKKIKKFIKEVIDGK